MEEAKSRKVEGADKKPQPRRRHPPRQPKQTKETEPTVSTIPPTEPIAKEGNSKEKMGGGKRHNIPKKDKKDAKIAAVETSRKAISTGLDCTICSSEDVQYFAMGHCNHPICSLCAMRLRVKSKSHDCAICKASLPVMVVYDVALMPSPGDLKFTDLGIYSDDIEGPPMPGTQVDVEAKMIFANCRDHYVTLSSLKRITCPCTEARCTFEGSSYAALIQHVQKRHDNKTMCLLCLENRPLFCVEQEVLSKKDMQLHLKGLAGYSAEGEDAAVNAAYLFDSGGHDNKFLTGHPRCEFCNTHFFDANTLYQHLQKEHFTCHLCDERFMFRYYPDVAALRKHHRSEHYLCSMCDKDPAMQSSDICYAFRTTEEVREHLQDVHRVRDAHRYTVGSHFGKVSYDNGHDSSKNNHGSRHGRNGKPAPRDYFDLDVGSANPYNPTTDVPTDPNARLENNRRGGARRGYPDLPRPPPAIVESNFPLLPPNMRLAGKISGTGRMQALDDSDLVLQEMADAAYRQRVLRDRVNNRNENVQALLRSTHAFPSLADLSGPSPQTEDTNSTGKNRAAIALKDAAIAATNTTTTSSVVQSASAAPAPASTSVYHPMSLANQKNALRVNASKVANVTSHSLAEERRIERNIALAEALGVSQNKDPSTNVLTADAVGATTGHSAYRQHLAQSLQTYRLPKTLLFLTLYPPELIAWARKNLTELGKVERKLQALLTDPKASSVALKPMKATERMVMHVLARYYNLLSYEYDPEPKRYVNVVKQVNSQVPDTLLSDACQRKDKVLVGGSGLGNQGQNAPEPLIYLQLCGASTEVQLTHEWGRSSDRLKQQQAIASTGTYAFQQPLVTVGEVLLRFQTFLLSENLLTWDDLQNGAITQIFSPGPSTLAVRFDDLYLAQQIELVLRGLQQRSIVEATAAMSRIPTTSSTGAVVATLASTLSSEADHHLTANGSSASFSLFPIYRLYAEFMSLALSTTMQNTSGNQAEEDADVVATAMALHADYEEDGLGPVIDAWEDSAGPMTAAVAMPAEAGGDGEDDDFEFIESPAAGSTRIIDAIRHDQRQQQRRGLSVNAPAFIPQASLSQPIAQSADDWEEVADNMLQSTTSTVTTTATTQPPSSSSVPSREDTAGITRAAPRTTTEDDWTTFLETRRQRTGTDALTRYRPPVSLTTASTASPVAPTTTTTTGSSQALRSSHVVSVTVEPGANGSESRAGSSSGSGAGDTAIPDVPVTSSTVQPYVMTTEEEDFLYALALQQAEDARSYYHMNDVPGLDDSYPHQTYGYDDGSNSFETGSQSQARQQQRWQRVGAPTAMPYVVSAAPATAISVHDDDGHDLPRGDGTDDDAHELILTSTLASVSIAEAVAVPTAVPVVSSMSEEPSATGAGAGITSPSTMGTAGHRPHQSQPSQPQQRKKGQRASSKFAGLVDDDEDED